MPIPTTILTFDIEDWFHLLDLAQTKTASSWETFPSRIINNTQRILDLLDQKNIKATFFCLGWVGKKYPDLIKAIHTRGFEIGSHTNLHQLVYEQTPDVFAADVAKSLAILQDITGTKIRCFRSPGFSLTRKCTWALDILIENGIEIDSSIFPAHRSHGGFPDFGAAGPVIIKTPHGALKEFPINLGSLASKKIVFSGGGYFRLFPYWLIKHFMYQSPYVMTYFHPRDFDPKQPLIPGLSLTRRFKAYYGLGSGFSKLAKLISDFPCTDIATVNNSFDWKNSRVIEIG